MKSINLLWQILNIFKRYDIQFPSRLTLADFVTRCHTYEDLCLNNSCIRLTLVFASGYDFLLHNVLNKHIMVVETIP